MHRDTLDATVDEVCPISGCRGRLWCRKELFLADTPSRAERLVSGDFVDDVDDRVSCGLYCCERR